MNRNYEKFYPYIWAALTFLSILLGFWLNGWQYPITITIQVNGNETTTFSSQLMQLLNASFQASLVVPSVLLTAQSIVFSDDTSEFIKYLKQAKAYSLFTEYFTAATTHGFILCLFSIILLVISNCHSIFHFKSLIGILVASYGGALVLSIASSFRVLDIFKEYSLNHGKGKGSV